MAAASIVTTHSNAMEVNPAKPRIHHSGSKHGFEPVTVRCSSRKKPPRTATVFLLRHQIPGKLTAGVIGRERKRRQTVEADSSCVTVTVTITAVIGAPTTKPRTLNGYVTTTAADGLEARCSALMSSSLKPTAAKTGTGRKSLTTALRLRTRPNQSDRELGRERGNGPGCFSIVVHRR